MNWYNNRLLLLQENSIQHNRRSKGSGQLNMERTARDICGFQERNTTGAKLKQSERMSHAASHILSQDTLPPPSPGLVNEGKRVDFD